LQRRHQKLVEEAPAPYLTDAQRAEIHSSAKAICREAGYHGAGTVEYLVGLDGTISFLEVNTRLQVEHPVSEETSGMDLVREQFRIAAGEKLRFTEDPAPRGHSIEFRINGEDAGRGFLPAPGTVSTFIAPDGPGVRTDSGVESGSVIGGAFDSLLAKLIVTGEDRTQALERSRRALEEMVVEGMATVLPFHRAVVRDPAFVGDDTGFTVHTRWIETEFDNTIPPFEGAADATEETPRQTVVVEVGGRRLEVSLPGDLAFSGAAPSQAGGAAKPRKRAGGKASAAVSGDAVTAPMQGTIVKVAVEDGQQVEAGELVVVLEAMKMENPVTAHKSGTVAGLAVSAGAAVTQGTVLLEIKD
jgi:acetyl-CoA/propionyl-CoA carboxylase biotin carboxyl carrier protein